MRKCLCDVVATYTTISRGLMVKLAPLKPSKDRNLLLLVTSWHWLQFELFSSSLLPHVPPQLLREFLPRISFLCWVLFVSGHYRRWKVRQVPLICHIDIYPKRSFRLFLRMSYCQYSSQSVLVFQAKLHEANIFTEKGLSQITSLVCASLWPLLAQRCPFWSTLTVQWKVLIKS